MRAALIRTLAGIAVVALVWAAAIALAGGFTFAVAGVRIASNNPSRPLAIGLVTSAAFILLVGPRHAISALRRSTARLTAAHAAWLLAVATTLTGLLGGTWTASGPDPFAYVSQAALLRSGRLDVAVPLAADAPWPDAVNTFSPFGYRPAPGNAAAIVPITAAGVPMAMAALQAIFGHCAAFVVTPMAGGALVLATFALGRRARSPATGLIAAWLVATSPAVLFMLMWPMSDVPAAACAAVLVWLLIRSSPASAFAAGLAAAAGVLTRPNFIIIAAGAAAWLVLEATVWRAGRGRWWRALLFGVGLLPGVAITAWLNARWYGSALSLGYGAAGDLLSISRVGVNLARYGRWILETSPFAVVGLGAIAFSIVQWRRAAAGIRIASLLATVVITACSVYLLYEPYAEWWFLRFMLPAWPAIFLAAAVVLDAVRVKSTRAAMVVTVLVTAAGVFGLVVARERGTFAVGPTERRYATIASLVDARTEPDAVILTSQHSGTVRYYAGRETLRYDVIDPAWLDRAIVWLTAQGRHPYILIDDWEQPIFERRFAGASPLAALQFTPVLAWQSEHVVGWVWLYDPLRRDAQTLRPGPEVESRRPLCAVPKHF